MSTSDPGPGPAEPTDGPYGQDPYAGQASQPGPYGRDPYGQGSYDQPPASAAPRNGLGLAALIVGIVALLLSLIPVVGLVVGVVALVLGVIALVRVRRGVATNRGVSITGVVLGGLAVVVGVVVLVLITVVVGSSSFQEGLQGVAACADVPEAQQEQCLADVVGQP